MKKEEAIFILNKIKPTMRRADGKSTSHILETIALDMAIKALEQEPCDNIKEYYKDIWDCDINHPRYEDTVAEIVEKSYMSGYVQGVENTAKEFRFELEQERWIPCENETGEGSNAYKCSACGEIQMIISGTPKENGWKYCPHCGAKMDEVEE